MGSGFSKSDLDSLFELDGVAVKGLIVGPLVTLPSLQFTRDLNVIFSLSGQDVAVYGESEVAAENPSFLCKTVDLAAVKSGYTFTMPDLEEHEDGYGKAYKITPRILRDGPQSSRVYLKEL